MNRKLLISLVASTFISNLSMAASPFEKYISNIAILENKDGRQLKTYEDVDDIKLDPFQARNKSYPIISETAIPEGYVKKTTASSFFKKFTSNILIVDEEISFNDFINEHMTIEGEDGTVYSDFPAAIDNILSPGRYAYSLKVDDNYRYVSSFMEYPPDALSCRVAPELCGDKCKVKTVAKKESNDRAARRRRRNSIEAYSEDWSVGYSNSSEYSSNTTKKVHVNGANNIYSDFRANMLAKASIKDARSINLKDSIVIKTEDRTPPFIKDGYEFLGEKLGTIEDCTSGDFYKTKDLEVADNCENTIYGKFTFGRLGGALPQDGDKWEYLEDWSYNENVMVVNIDKQKVTHYQYGKDVSKGFSDIVRFPDFDGVIRYSVFLKESGNEGNTNPGVEVVMEDSPETGYGYKKAGDLGRNALTAKPWPDKRALQVIGEKGQDTNYIRVHDNDRPNILIRVTEVETGKQMFFPPCIPAGQFPVKTSKLYKAVSGLNSSNQGDYDLFVKDLSPEYDYSLITKNPNGIPYYTIYAVNGSDQEELSGVSAGMSKMLNNHDLKFINQNVRLEDYYFSDTDNEGKITYHYKDDELGKKLGTTASMTVLFENSGNFVFKPDMEYQLDVWTDDNVKWTNIKPVDLNDPTLHHDASGNIIGVNLPEILEYAKVYATGIKEGVIRVNIPDEHENLCQEEKIDISKSINGGISFILKNSTISKRNFASTDEIDKSGIPYIEVTAWDFAGYSRNIKLYFRVGDRNINIRTLDGD